MQKWEYDRLQVNPSRLRDADDRINELGRDGWELVSVVPVVQAGSATNIHMYFKRPIDEDQQ